MVQSQRDAEEEALCWIYGIVAIAHSFAQERDPGARVGSYSLGLWVTELGFAVITEFATTI